MGFKFKIAYTKNKNAIPEAISNGTIDKGDLIIVDNGENADGELVFIADDGRQITFFSEDILNKIEETITESEDIVETIQNVALEAIQQEGALDAGELE